MFRILSYELNLRTFSVLKTALISTDNSVDLGVDLVNKDPIINIMEYLINIIRVSTQSITISSLKLIIKLKVYNKN